MNEYEKQAQDFLRDTGTKMTVVRKGTTTEFIKGMTNEIYRVTLKNNNHSYTFDFHNSAHAFQNNLKLTAYDVLASLPVYIFADYDDYCADLGYTAYCDESGNKIKESKKAYNAVIKQGNELTSLFDDDQLNQLAEIS